MIRFRQFAAECSHYLFLSVLWLLLFLAPNPSFAQQQFVGQWYEVKADWRFPDPPFKTIDAPFLTGGHFVFRSFFDITDTDETIVIDFKNASVLGRFHHYISDSTGKVVAEARGGIESDSKNTFFLRHGREFSLPPGQYQLTTELVSTYFIAEPQPYWDSLSHYREAIKLGTVITLVSMGILISLGVYYAILAYVRRRTTETMYAIFIWMNVIFNGTSLLITPDLFNLNWFYLAGAPILLSNFAYLLFAKHLLQIRASTHPRLHNLAKLILTSMAVLLVVAIFNKHLILECARYGVGLMMVYGLIAALVRAFEGYKIAYFYLVAIAAFFMIGSYAISSKDLVGIYTIYIEHIGLLAVTVEVLLIGLVLGYQFAEIYREKENNLALIQHSLQIAHHDALTGLPNRYALDLTLEKLPSNGMITLLDMDNLKVYNDTYGHQKGDEMLQMFANILSTKLGKLGVLHRMGGDEFAITSESLAYAEKIKQVIAETIDYMQQNGFEKAGVSYGSAYMMETLNIEDLRMLADERMYQHKRRNNNPQWA
ncbi:diguanylate cyclase domain-containing protein [Methylophaga sp.]|uniref:diguanylate cyclase domain-containing protein n=1 Tax=Methylophaga sp. TaxID=2024840 RepID=UPI0027239DF8|nr:diguanylate cyclase [Methylophaga sp.]MDO8826623.1 diguanylate cyclase [Methylophaga sp.]